jgi:Right handed beta helix region
MNKFRFTIKITAIAIFTFAFASLAQAQATRTWVSGVGDDVNPCSRTAPCKTFAGAISKTATGGEINALDPAGYGAVTITKAITIDGGGGQVASVLASGSNGVIINAASTSVVILRNLRFNGIRQAVTPGLDGIKFIAGKGLIVENCDIFGWGSNGINVALTAAVSGNQQVSIKNSIIENNALSGISVANTAGGVSVSIDNVKSDMNLTNGFSSGNGCISDVSNSTFSFNGTAGINILNGTTQSDVDSCIIVSNGDGIRTAAATTRIANCRISANGNGINFVGGVVQSFGDNKVKGNFTNDQLGGAVALVGAPVKI